jgi:HAMP domain-containing protein
VCSCLVSQVRDPPALARVLVMDGWALVRQAIEAALGFWDRVKQATAIWLRFLDGWFRILVSLFMAVVIVAACYWTWSTWQSWRLEELASVTRTWPNGKILNDVTVEIKTKCSDSVLSYVVVMVTQQSNAALNLAEKTDAAKVMTDRLRERLKVIHVQLVDKDGLPTAAYDVAIDEFVRIYSSNEERLTSLEAWGTLACSPASYVRAEALIVSWTERP